MTGSARLVRGVVQPYAWGDPYAIAELTGQAPDGRPWAELWFGTHPGGPATVLDDDAAPVPLEDVAGPLPYLLKLLAAAAPLSLQTHPTARQAAAGFAREQAQGLALDDPARLYRDPLPKPEMLVALSEFEALCGLLPLERSVAVLHSIGGPGPTLAALLDKHGYHVVLERMLRATHELDEWLRACRHHESDAAARVLDLARRYPGDPAAVVTLLLHHVRLRPGQALYLQPGNLHAYLGGTGIEVMGSSDNVIRAGLTNKTVDVDEVLAVADTSPLADPLCRPSQIANGVWRYPTPDAPFTLLAHNVTGTTNIHAATRELVICATGGTDVLPRGAVAYLAADEEIAVHGTATLFRVGEAY